MLFRNTRIPTHVFEMLVVAALVLVALVTPCVSLLCRAWLSQHAPPSSPVAESAAQLARDSILSDPPAHRPSDPHDTPAVRAWFLQLGVRSPATDADWPTTLSLLQQPDADSIVTGLYSLPALLSDGKMPGSFLASETSPRVQEVAAATLAQTIAGGPPYDLDAASACFVSRLWLYRPDIRSALSAKPESFKSNERVRWGYLEMLAKENHK